MYNELFLKNLAILRNKVLEINKFFFEKYLFDDVVLESVHSSYKNAFFEFLFAYPVVEDWGYPARGPAG